MFKTFHKQINVQPFCALVQQVRYRLVNTRKPRPPHFWAQKIQEVLKPKFPTRYDKDFPPHLMCSKQFEKQLIIKTEEENPYERILANELKDKLLQSKMLLICHINPIEKHIYLQSKIQFFKEGIKLLRNSRRTVKMAVENTKFENITRLFESNTIMICGPEVKLNLAYKLLKNMKFFILLGGVVEDRFLDRSRLDELSKIPNIDVARAQLVATLNLPAVNMQQLLLQNQMQLVSHIDQHVELQKKANQPDVPAKSEESNPDKAKNF